MVVVQTGGYYGLMNWLPTIVQKQLGITVQGSSSIWMISTIVGMCIGMLIFGNILDHLGHANHLAFSWLVLHLSFMH